MRPLQVWGGFALAVALMVGAVGWISRTVLALEQAEGVSLQRAAMEDNVRLALWRMDSTGGALVAQESARPHYAAPEDAPYVLAYFQLDQSDAISTPGTPLPADRLAKLKSALSTRRLREEFPKGPDEPEPEPEVFQTANAAPNDDVVQNSINRSANEYRARSMNVYRQQAFTKTSAPQKVALPKAAPVVVAGPVKPLWMGSELFLARAVKVGARASVQGCWLDWPSLKKDLCTNARDLLPRVTLEPAFANAQAGVPDTRRLASIPVQLVPGEDVAPAAPVTLATLTRSPLGMSLVAAWGAVALAALAVAALLLGVLSLSERRATFVSAVTHELRTPLTTFRLYTDLLAQDLVTDPDKRRSYLETLRREAERLGHLVENVLAYARLERGKSGRRLEPVQVGAMMERCRPRLEERAKAAGMELAVELPDAVAARTISTDTAAVEQVLFNLVDNACKYGAGPLSIAVGGERATQVSVRDRGPGISRGEARKLFQPFSRSAEQAAGSAPGVGLGLALSRQLARQLGGDLVLETPREGPGARFTLSLP